MMKIMRPISENHEANFYSKCSGADRRDEAELSAFESSLKSHQATFFFFF